MRDSALAPRGAGWVRRCTDDREHVTQASFRTAELRELTDAAMIMLLASLLFFVVLGRYFIPSTLAGALKG